MRKTKKDFLKQADRVQTTIYLSRKTKAWLVHQAAIEGRSSTEIVDWLLHHYHKKCTDKDPRTPPID